ncbi:hypothetical protein [Novosphingobium arvoryzae]|nr:hypothetical protein [Novosphingobium arvoryzae]
MNTSLIEHIYLILRNAKLTTTRQAFSQEYVGKNQNWSAYQAHMKRDFSIAGAINCLRSIRLCKERDAALDLVQLCALREAEALLLEHLSKRYSVAEVVS